MCTLLLFLVVSTVSATYSGRTRRNAEIDALVERVVALETQGQCRPEVRIHVDFDGGHVEDDHHDHDDHGQDVDHSHEQHGHTHDSHTDHGEHHDDSHAADDSDEHDDHHAQHDDHDHDHHSDASASGVDVHLHLHMDPHGGMHQQGGHHEHGSSGPEHSDPYYYATCYMQPAAGQSVGGQIYLRQNWENKGSDVEFGFEVSGLTANTKYEIHVYEFGDTSDQCGQIGDMWMAAGGDHAEHGRQARAAHHGQHGARGGAHAARRPAGYMQRKERLSCDVGDVLADGDGNVGGTEDHDEVTFLGMARYILAGRSLAIRTSGVDGAIVGCCSVLKTKGTHWQ